MGENVKNLESKIIIYVKMVKNGDAGELSRPVIVIISERR